MEADSMDGEIVRVDLDAVCERQGHIALFVPPELSEEESLVYIAGWLARREQQHGCER